MGRPKEVAPHAFGRPAYDKQAFGSGQIPLDFRPIPLYTGTMKIYYSEPEAIADLADRQGPCSVIIEEIQDRRLRVFSLS